MGTDNVALTLEPICSCFSSGSSVFSVVRIFERHLTALT
jgi:hypothetical protein